MKNFLFVMRNPPYLGSNIRESLDMMMTVAAFDQSVKVLFLDDGVFLLKPGQCPHYSSLRPTAPLFAALEMYDVEGLWAEQESLTERGLDSSELIIPVRSLRRTEIAFFLAAADIVVSC
ncbi:MAG: sulfurtransferase complex subunit TusC [Candidatus Methylumidiphilus sp.]